MRVYEFMLFLDEITEDERLSLMAELTPQMLGDIYKSAHARTRQKERL